MVSLVSTVQTPSHWVMLEDGKISDKVLYTEEDIKQAIYQAISYPETFVTGICCDDAKIKDWIKQYKKH